MIGDVCLACGKLKASPGDHERPEDPEIDQKICWNEDPEDCLDELEVDTWAVIAELRYQIKLMTNVLESPILRNILAWLSASEEEGSDDVRKLSAVWVKYRERVLNEVKKV